MEGITFRPARLTDVDRIAEIIAGDPGQQAIGIAGDRDRARRLGIGFVKLEGSPQGWERTVVAELEGQVVGVLQAGPGIPSVGVTPAIALLTIRVFGTGVFGFLRRFRAQERVHMQRPAGAYYIAELHVDPGLRGRGIGGALLDLAEERAREGGFPGMALGTTITNPARRLYERHGFRIVDQRTDPDYERYTGIPGRVLMAKDFEQAEAAPRSEAAL